MKHNPLSVPAAPAILNDQVMSQQTFNVNVYSEDEEDPQVPPRDFRVGSGASNNTSNDAKYDESAT